MSERRRDRQRRPLRAGDLLAGLTRQLGVEERLPRYRVWQVWESVVGVQTAGHARPLRFRDGVLEVRVDHPVWMQQLQLLKPRILERLNQAIAPAEITDIHWRQGRIDAPATPASPPHSVLSAPPEEVEAILPADEDDIHAAWRTLLAFHLGRRHS